jgi:hypothetical protein
MAVIDEEKVAKSIPIAVRAEGSRAPARIDTFMLNGLALPPFFARPIARWSPRP